MPTQQQKKEKSSALEPARLPVYANDYPPLAALDIIDMAPEKLEDFDGHIRKNIMDHLGTRNFSAAAKVAEDKLKSSPKNAALMNLAGALFLHAGDIQRAEILFARAEKLNPKDPQIVNNLACAAMHKRDYKKAADLLTACLRRTPAPYAQYHYNLAACLYELRSRTMEKYLGQAEKISITPETMILRALHTRAIGELKAGYDILVTAMGRFPKHQDIRYYLCGFLYELGHELEGLDTLVDLVLNNPDNEYYAVLATNYFRSMQFTVYREKYIDVVAHILRCGRIHTRHMDPIWESLLRLHPVWSPLIEKAMMMDRADFQSVIDTTKKNGALTHPFITLALPCIMLRSPKIETFLAGLRRAYLERMAQGTPLDDQDKAFLSALCLHHHYHEYAQYISVAELDLLKEVGQKPISTDTLLILCCYAPITQYLSTEAAQAYQKDPLFENLVREQVTYPAQEMALMKTIPTLTKIQDDVSRNVEQMYLENPYPRWHNINYSHNPGFLHLSPRHEDRSQVLVAGCGTGLHSTTSALTYENIDMLAIDLSRRSIAYALRRTQELGIPNIRYAQADILELGSIRERFDIIESSGVLHHLADPIQGLRVLLSLLRPGGFLRLGLYSELARQAVVAARSYVKNKGYPPTPEGIRAFRHDMITLPDSDPLYDITSYGDFYSTSSCRDLVFHVQEHRFTIPQIKKMLEDHELDFRLFNINAIHLEAFRKSYPAPNDTLNLDYWAAFEEENPHTFRGMYQFWAQKRL